MNAPVAPAPVPVAVMDDHFRDFLRSGGNGIVHSVFPHAMNIRSAVRSETRTGAQTAQTESALFSIVQGGSPAPYTANIETPDAANFFSGIRVGDPIETCITLDASRARLFPSAYKRPGGLPDAAIIANGLAAFEAYCAAAPFTGGCTDFFDLPARLQAFAAAVRNRRPFENELRRILGAGPGLTPSGDDFLCGVLFILHNADTGDTAAGAAADLFARMAAILSGPLPTTDVSAHMIRAHLAGESASVFRDLLEAFCGEADLPAVMKRVRSVGHSSGMDFAIGMATALEILPGQKSRRSRGDG